MKKITRYITVFIALLAVNSIQQNILAMQCKSYESDNSSDDEITVKNEAFDPSDQTPPESPIIPNTLNGLSQEDNETIDRLFQLTLLDDQELTIQYLYEILKITQKESLHRFNDLWETKKANWLNSYLTSKNPINLLSETEKMFIYWVCQLRRNIKKDALEFSNIYITIIPYLKEMRANTPETALISFLFNTSVLMYRYRVETKK